MMVMQDIAMDNKKIFMGCGAAHPQLCERVTKTTSGTSTGSGFSPLIQSSL